jgi:hypothetical protein
MCSAMNPVGNTVCSECGARLVPQTAPLTEAEGPRPEPVEGPRPEPVEGLPPTDEKAGYSLLDESGEPKPAYHALRAELNRRWGHRLARWVERTQAALLEGVPSVVTILAADEAVHLGDSE